MHDRGMGPARTLTAAGFALATVTACADSASYEPTWTNGSRLRAIVHVSEDGYVGLVGWRDIEVTADCHAGNRIAGELETPLCAPSPPILYVNATCTSPAIVPGPSTYIAQGERVFRVANTSSRRPIFAPTAGSDCAFMGEAIVALVEEVPADILVRRTSTALVPGQLVVERTTDDGSREIIVNTATTDHGAGESRLVPIWNVHERWRDQAGVLDTAFGLPCDIADIGQGLACQVPTTSSATAYRNAQCTDPVDVAPSIGVADGFVWDTPVRTPLWYLDNSAIGCVPLAGGGHFERSRRAPDVDPIRLYFLIE
jgi:hypothetical protein